jgi:hypothetical protein
MVAKQQIIDKKTFLHKQQAWKAQHSIYYALQEKFPFYTGEKHILTDVGERDKSKWKMERIHRKTELELT